MLNMVKEETKPKDKSVLTLFIIVFMSLILIAIGYIEQPFLRIALQVMVFLLQFIVIKNVLDDYYRNF